MCIGGLNSSVEDSEDNFYCPFVKSLGNCCLDIYYLKCYFEMFFSNS